MKNTAISYTIYKQVKALKIPFIFIWLMVKSLKCKIKEHSITYVYFSMKPVFSLDFVLVFMKVGGSTNYIIILKNW